MPKIRVLLLAIVLASTLAPGVQGQASGGPDTVTVQSGALTLHALLWRPDGRGPFPAVLFNHGSYGSGDPPGRTDPASLGSVFARRGYVFLFLFRRGIGLSADQGTADGDLMDRASAAHGPEGRNRVQMQLLETEELNEALAGLAFLRALPGVDARRLGVAGHSFGGALTLLLAARDTTLRAVVDFSGAAYSWGLAGAPGSASRGGRPHHGTSLLHPPRERLLDRVGAGAGRRDAAAWEAAPPEDLPSCRSHPQGWAQFPIPA